jgi:hypothetical protein
MRSHGVSPTGRSRSRWQFTAPAVLLLLTEGPSHGYRLQSRLRPMLPRNAAPPDAAAVYRVLHGLESTARFAPAGQQTPDPAPPGACTS